MNWAKGFDARLSLDGIRISDGHMDIVRMYEADFYIITASGGPDCVPKKLAYAAEQAGADLRFLCRPGTSRVRKGFTLWGVNARPVDL